MLGESFKLEPMVTPDGMPLIYELLYRSNQGFPKDQATWRAWYQDLPERVSEVFDSPDMINRSISLNYDTWQLLDRRINDSLLAMAPLADQIILEWTERAEDFDRMNAAACRLRELREEWGFHVALDDVGMPEMPARQELVRADIAKIDGALFQRAIKSPDMYDVLMRHMHSFREHGAKIVVEWVETIHQEIFARRLGADLTQGFFWTDETLALQPEIQDQLLPA